MSNKVSFTFAVLVYNHSQYIIEHLESMKYLINTYGGEWDFNLVIADDGSTDDSLAIISYWLSKNTKLFKNVIIEGDGNNHGVGISYTNIWKHINDDYYKILAGDDVYSNYNLFLDSELLHKFNYVSGIPLSLIDGELNKSTSTIFNMLATDRIYRNKKFGERLKKISLMNSPSLLYSSKFVKNNNVFKFIRKFMVTEDYPMMAKLSEEYSDITFHQTKNVHIYYRRTSGSIYLVENKKFNEDKLKVFNYLLDKQQSVFSTFLLKNRIYCYSLKNSFLKKIINVNYYCYFFSVLLRLPLIIKDYLELSISINTHEKHFKLINKKSTQFMNEYKKTK